MTPATFISNVQVLEPGLRVAPGSLLVRGGQIERIDKADSPVPPGAVHLDGAGRLLTPGLVDLHIHGVHEYLFERSGEDILAAAEVLPRYGVTCVLPTLYRVMNRQSIAHLKKLAAALQQVKSSRLPGFHLEGPFLALAGAGADTFPGDVALLEELYAACEGRLAAMSISPETPNILPVIRWLAKHNIAAFITHTRASVEQTEAAIDAGARHATHFYDVFPLPEETEPGVRPCGAVEAILADARASVDFIADGCHVHPVAIRAALAAKGWQNLVCITDANIGAGLAAGEYPTPWGFSVRVRPGDGARIADPAHELCGGLAGSALTMNQGVKNLLNWLPIPPQQVWAMATANPARLLNIPRLGTMAVGAPADLVLWNEDLTAAKTWVGGKLVHDEAPQGAMQ